MRGSNTETMYPIGPHLPVLLLRVSKAHLLPLGKLKRTPVGFLSTTDGQKAEKCLDSRMRYRRGVIFEPEIAEQRRTSCNGWQRISQTRQ